MEQPKLPDWESDLVADAIRAAERRLDEERARARGRALQLAREQAYHRLAVAIDRPHRPVGPDQLSFFPERTLFDDDAG